MFEQLPGDGRHAAGIVDPLAFDQLHRQLGVPLVHEHQFDAGSERRDHRRVTSRRVKQRHN
jgi:hypothetical protein